MWYGWRMTGLHYYGFGADAVGVRCYCSLLGRGFKPSPILKGLSFNMMSFGDHLTYIYKCALKITTPTISGMFLQNLRT